MLACCLCSQLQDLLVHAILQDLLVLVPWYTICGQMHIVAALCKARFSRVHTRGSDQMWALG